MILTNVGPALTPSLSSGKEEPKAGKVALLTRTVAFNVRSFAAARNTSQDDFKSHLQLPRVQQRVSEFRMLTSLAMFCRLAILRVPALQPDLGYARVMFRQFDDMLGAALPLVCPELAQTPPSTQPRPPLRPDRSFFATQRSSSTCLARIREDRTSVRKT